MQRSETGAEYLLAFSSFYQAMYARDKLAEQGIASQLRKAPTQLFRSCGQALYLEGYELRKVLTALNENRIQTKGIYEAVSAGNQREYRRIQ